MIGYRLKLKRSKDVSTYGFQGPELEVSTGVSVVTLLSWLAAQLIAGWRCRQCQQFGISVVQSFSSISESLVDMEMVDPNREALWPRDITTNVRG